MCVAAKILINLLFFVLFFWSFPLNFDKEKWNYMYIEQFLENGVFFIFMVFNIIITKKITKK